ncbi:MAG TPA: helix-turn-helix domain-containing protein [Solirubrobacterales bacterium]|nr:helix-turn-helix domain-containing protein [Solirubrobacterales bacterium]
MPQADLWVECDFDQVRILKGLAHPIRLELLGILGQRDMSPARFARLRGEPVSNVTYHFRVLERSGLIELVQTRPVGGSIEHIYRQLRRVFVEADGERLLVAVAALEHRCERVVACGV